VYGRRTDIQEYSANNKLISVDNQVLGNRGHKYKNIIAPLMSDKKVRTGLPRAMTLNDNKINYIHWNDPNKLVDLQLLEALRQAGHNGHNNEILEKPDYKLTMFYTCY